MKLYVKEQTTVTVSDSGQATAHQGGKHYPYTFPTLVTFAHTGTYLATDADDLGTLLTEQGYQLLSLEHVTDER